MKIGVVCYPTFGGSGVVATELGHAMAKKGVEVHFFAYKQPVRLDTISKNIFFHEVTVPEYPLFKFQPYELALSSKIVDTVIKHNINLLHVHYAIPHAYAAFMAKKVLLDQGINIPFVTTLHGTDITLVGSHPFYKSAVSFSINNSDLVTAVSDNLKKQTIDLFKVKKEIEVIPNFIDFSIHQSHNENCNRENIAKKNEKIISHVSNFRAVKRVLDVIKVFEKINKKLESKLILVGEGPEKEIAQRYCITVGIENNVRFLGESNQVYEVLCYSDLFLLTSQAESFGLAALEAMMMSVPVISTNIGGLPEINIEGVSGYLFDVGDIKGMAKKSIEILSDQTTLQKLKKSSRENAKRYDIEKVLELYINVYDRTLK